MSNRLARRDNSGAPNFFVFRRVATLLLRATSIMIVTRGVFRAIIFNPITVYEKFRFSPFLIVKPCLRWRIRANRESRARAYVERRFIDAVTNRARIL